MDQTALLKELGLTDAEAIVYISLLESGKCGAGSIIRKAGFHRATTYQILRRLMEKGFVSSVVEEKAEHFSAASPKRLLDVLLEKENKLRKALPSLEALCAAGRENQEITVYSGAKGIRSALDRMLDELGKRGEYFDFGVSGLFREVIGPYFQSWQEAKKKNRITSHVIFNCEVKENKKLLQEYYGKARFCPKGNPSFTDTMIYNDTVVLLIWTAKPPLAIVIKNRENAQSYKNQFLLMWKNAKR